MRFIIYTLATMACTPAPSSDIEGTPPPPAWTDTGIPAPVVDTGSPEPPEPDPLTHLTVVAVVDNTSSMLGEQQRLADAVSTWEGPGVPWTLHVVTTDSADPLAVTSDQAVMAEALIVGLDGDTREMGMLTANWYLASLAPIDGGGVLLIMLSDEDDYSGYKPESVADELDGLTDRASVLAIVAGDPVCYGAVETGQAYLDLLALVGGVHLDICAPDYLPALVEAAAML